MSDATDREYAQVLLELSDWNLNTAKELLVDRCLVSATSTNVRARDAVRKVADVSPWLVKLREDRDVQEAKKLWEADLKSRFKEIYDRAPV
jgi:hypothetical protein